MLNKLEQNPYEDLKWNIPERKQGRMNVIGGNGQSFRTPVKIAEFLGAHYPIEVVNLVLPDALQGKLPPVPEVVYLKSTEAGSLADEEGLTGVMQVADYNLVVGDLSKNAVTGRIVASACENSALPLLITRDAVDIVAENGPEKLLMKENLVIMASVAQLMKLLRSVYYPKMLLMTQSLAQVVEVLHKFTLSYPAGFVTLHNGQILVAKDGEVVAVPLEKSGHSALTFWMGEMAAKIAVLNLYNPNNFVPATVAAVFA